MLSAYPLAGLQWSPWQEQTVNAEQIFDPARQNNESVSNEPFLQGWANKAAVSVLLSVMLRYGGSYIPGEI